MAKKKVMIPDTVDEGPAPEKASIEIVVKEGVNVPADLMDVVVAHAEKRGFREIVIVSASERAVVYSALGALWKARKGEE